MSHFRFKHALNNLRDCHDNMSDDDLDKSEEKARFELIRLCVEIALDCGYRIDYHIEAVQRVN